MPLNILLPMVVIGIAGIAALLHLLGLSRALHFADPDSARAAWNREFPDTPALQVILCQNKRAALIDTPDGPGVVWSMGADSTARFLTGARAMRKPDGIALRLPDFTAPNLRLRLDPDETNLWLTHLQPSPQSSLQPATRPAPMTEPPA